MIQRGTEITATARGTGRNRDLRRNQGSEQECEESIQKKVEDIGNFANCKLKNIGNFANCLLVSESTEELQVLEEEGRWESNGY